MRPQRGAARLWSAKCTAAVRLLLRGLREAQDEAAGGGAVSWAAISAKFRAKGSKLKAMRAALPARWRHWLREWLSEVLAVHTDLVSRRTLGISSAVRSRPYDGFALTAAGHAKLCQLEQLGGAGAGPVWISVPRWLAGSLRGRRDGSVLADCDGGEDETEGGSESEEDETGLPHAGYCHAIQPRPATGAALSRGLPVAVFFAAPHNGWHDGAVAQDSATVGGSVLVRFADGEFRLRLSRTGFGRFAMWVIRDTSREEEWRPDGHELLQRECLVNGRGGTVRMWCAQRGRFAASAHDEKEEFEMSLAETQGAVHLLTERQLHGAPPSAATPERAPSTLTSPSAPPDGTASPAAATPWLLRWELERQRARSGWQPSEESLALLHEAWLRHDAPLPPLDVGRMGRAGGGAEGACSAPGGWCRGCPWLAPASIRVRIGLRLLKRQAFFEPRCPVQGRLRDMYVSPHGAGWAWHGAGDRSGQPQWSPPATHQPVATPERRTPQFTACPTPIPRAAPGPVCRDPPRGPR